MPQPTDTSILVRGALDDVSLLYKNELFVADQLFPIINGLGRQSKVTKFKKGPWFRDEAAERAPGTAARVSGYNIGTENLNPVQYAIASAVSKEIIADATAPGNLPTKPKEEAIAYCANGVDLKKERVTAAKVFAQAWADGNTGGEDAEGKWGLATTSNTLEADVISGKQTIRLKTGIVPNTLLIDYDTLVAQSQNPILAEKIKYTQTDIMSPELLASLLGLKKVIVASSIYSTALEAADGDDFSGANIWEVNAGKGSAFLYYRPETAGLYQPSPGYQYRLTVEGQSRRTYTWYENAKHSWMFEVQEDVDIAVVDSSLGYLWNDTHTT